MLRFADIGVLRQRFDLRGEHNGHCVIHYTLSKQQSVEVPVCMELIKDGQHRHYTQTQTEKKHSNIYSHILHRTQNAVRQAYVLYLGLWQR